MAKVKKVKSFENLPVDVLEAIRRALERRGLIRQKTTTPEVVQANPTTKGTKKLVEAAVKSHDILFKANTVFPFTLFPDTVTLDREKVTFAERFFFLVANITSVPVRDLLSVQADIGPFFGSVHTASRYFVTNPKTIRFLWREDALRLQRLIQGYIIAHEQEIDCSKIPTGKLKSMLLAMGKGSTD